MNNTESSQLKLDKWVKAFKKTNKLLASEASKKAIKKQFKIEHRLYWGWRKSERGFLGVAQFRKREE